MLGACVQDSPQPTVLSPSRFSAAGSSTHALSSASCLEAQWPQPLASTTQAPHFEGHPVLPRPHLEDLPRKLSSGRGRATQVQDEVPGHFGGAG